MLGSFERWPNSYHYASLARDYYTKIEPILECLKRSKFFVFK